MEPDILNGLDEFQREAVLSEAKRILVVAPPGSGKTRVLASRFARLVKEGVSPDGLLAVTFTNRAAREMRERISGLTGLREGLLNVETFHSFCLKLLKRSTPGFALISREEGVKILKELGIKNPERIAEKITAAKNGASQGSEDESLRRYQERLKELRALDFDDLIIEGIKTLEDGASDGFKKSHIMVDEFQDINPLQSRLVRLLSEGSTLLAIGDPDQSVYAFRGASLKSFMDFENDYKGVEVIKLKRNYRSASAIVTASEALIANNAFRISKDTEYLREGGSIEVVECHNEKAEAEWITRKIESMMGGLSNLTAGDCTDSRFSDFAVLFRTNRQAEALTDAFLRSSIPFHVVEPPGPGFMDFIKHLKGIKALPGVPFSEFIASEGKSLNLQDDVIELFVRGAKGYEEWPFKLDDYIDEMLLSQPSDNYDVKADKVNLMTLHMAKGLEFRAVFITGAEEGLIPLNLKGGDTDIEEERRLFYVGMTRAKERLYLISSRSRRIWGEDCHRQPSPFLREIPDWLIKKITVEKKEVKRRPVQKGLFE